MMMSLALTKEPFTESGDPRDMKSEAGLDLWESLSRALADSEVPLSPVQKIETRYPRERGDLSGQKLAGALQSLRPSAEVGHWG